MELFTGKAVAARDNVLHALPEAPELRERAYHIKQKTMANLDRYLEEMADNVEGRGGNVFFAEDGEDVVRYIGDLARRKGAKIVTKSKSMATEEIELNRRLEEDYADLELEIVETDLGEWIAQLAGDHPSHIVGPILHMNRSRITGVLSGRRGKSLPPDVEALGSFARRRLREKFLAADIGITGANFGVAETGTVATITNEGNASLVTSVPPVHVVVMGIEKVVPRFEDLSSFIRLLARSGTGQKLTVYTNFITGPRGGGELDGARGAAPHPHGQRPLQAARHRVRGGALLHPLRRLPERLPGLPPDRRPRLRLDLLRAHRRRHNPATQGAQGRQGPAPRLQSCAARAGRPARLASRSTTCSSSSATSRSRRA